MSADDAVRVKKAAPARGRPRGATAHGNQAPEKGREFTNLGKRLRQTRRLKRLTLKDVAGRVECSESLLSKIECDKITPSLRMLHRIVSVLDTSIGLLFADERDGDFKVYKRGDRPAVVINDETGGSSIRLERLVPQFGDQAIDGNIHVVEPGATNGGDIKHFGQEVGYVLEGSFELTISNQVFQLESGDSFFFRSDLPHSYRNTGDTVARILWINTPPTF